MIFLRIFVRRKIKKNGVKYYFSRINAIMVVLFPWFLVWAMYKNIRFVLISMFSERV